MPGVRFSAPGAGRRCSVPVSALRGVIERIEQGVVN
jgi:hypothetical protein